MMCGPKDLYEKSRYHEDITGLQKSQPGRMAIIIYILYLYLYIYKGVDKNMEKLESLFPAGENIKWRNYYGK